MTTTKLAAAIVAAAALSGFAAPSASAGAGDGKLISSTVGQRAMVEDRYAAWTALMRIN